MNIGDNPRVVTVAAPDPPAAAEAPADQRVPQLQPAAPAAAGVAR